MPVGIAVAKPLPHRARAVVSRSLRYKFGRRVARDRVKNAVPLWHLIFCRCDENRCLDFVADDEIQSSGLSKRARYSPGVNAITPSTISGCSPAIHSAIAELRELLQKNKLPPCDNSRTQLKTAIISCSASEKPASLPATMALCFVSFSATKKRKHNDVIGIKMSKQVQQFESFQDVVFTEPVNHIANGNLGFCRRAFDDTHSLNRFFIGDILQENDLERSSRLSFCLCRPPEHATNVTSKPRVNVRIEFKSDLQDKHASSTGISNPVVR